MFVAKEKKIEDILLGESKRYRIPRNQREYSWEENNIDEFWNDIIAGKRSLPFIGTFVFNEEEKKKTGYSDIIDGQQRILTITLFFATLRDIARENDLTKLSDGIQRKAIADVSVTGRDKDFRVLCGDSLKDFFETNIQSGEEGGWVEADTEEEKRVEDAYELLKEKIKHKMANKKSQEDKEEVLEDLYQKVSALEVIEIRIDSNDKAYIVFETVNARGVDLGIADLLKNLIFQEVIPEDGKKDIAKEKWQEIIDNVRGVDASIARFIRYHWISKYNHTTKKGLFRDIKNNITDKKAFLDELLKSSRWYHRILSDNPADWEIKEIEKTKKIFRSLLGINAMRVKQCYVIFLALLRNAEELEFKIDHYFETIEKFTFVYSAISKLQANKVEKLYSQTAIELEKAIDNNLSKREKESILGKMVQRLKDLKPEYPSFEEKFMDISYKHSTKQRRLLKYLLNKIDEQEGGEEFTIDFDVVNLEHILPQTYNEEWDIEKHIHGEYKDKLGNLVLIHKKINSKAGNKSLDEKIDILSETKIPSTVKVVEYIKDNNRGEWGNHDILGRQKKLAKLSYNKVWDY